MSDDVWTLHGGNCPERALALSQAHRPGAVLCVEATRRSLDRLRAARVPREREGALLQRAWLLVADALPDQAVGRRSLWSCFEFVVEGPRAWLQMLGRQVLRALEADDDLKALHWQVVFTSLFEPEPTASFSVDRGATIRGADGNLLVWVEPLGVVGRRGAGARPRVTVLPPA